MVGLGWGVGWGLEVWQPASPSRKHRFHTDDKKKLVLDTEWKCERSILVIKDQNRKSERRLCAGGVCFQHQRGFIYKAFTPLLKAFNQVDGVKVAT